MNTAFLLYISPILAPLTEEQEIKASKFDLGMLCHSIDVLPDQVTYSGAHDFTFYENMRAAFRARNPRHKSGFYQALGYVVPWDKAYTWVDDSYLLHSQDGVPLIGQVSGLTFKFLNLGSQAVRTKMIDHYLEYFGDDIDVLMLDGFAPKFYRDIVHTAGNPNPACPYFNLSQNCLEGQTTDVNWWMNALSTYTNQLRYAMEQRGKHLNLVGIYPMDDAQLGNNLSNVVKFSTSALFEHPTVGWYDPALYKRSLETVRASTLQNKSVIYSVSPNLLGLTSDYAMQRFWQASYKLIEESNTFYSYYEHEPYRGWTLPPNPTTYIYRPTDWDKDIGIPLGPYVEIVDPYGRGNGYARVFTKGSVLVNPTSSPLQLAHPTPLGPVYRWDVVGAPLHMELDAPYYRLNIPPKTGWMLIPAV